MKKQILLICILTLIFSNVSVALAQSGQKLSINDFTFQLSSCRSSGGNMTCQFMITNDASADRRFVLYANSSRMFDDGGNEYIGTQAQVGTIADSQIVLAAQVPVKGWIKFEKVSSEATIITLLRLNCESDDTRGTWTYRPWNADFRNVQITK
jgi:hypothetical protein